MKRLPQTPYERIIAELEERQRTAPLSPHRWIGYAARLFPVTDSFDVCDGIDKVARFRRKADAELFLAAPALLEAARAALECLDPTDTRFGAEIRQLRAAILAATDSGAFQGVTHAQRELPF